MSCKGSPVCLSFSLYLSFVPTFILPIRPLPLSLVYLFFSSPFLLSLYSLLFPHTQSLSSPALFFFHLMPFGLLPPSLLLLFSSPYLSKIVFLHLSLLISLHSSLPFLPPSYASLLRPPLPNPLFSFLSHPFLPCHPRTSMLL